MSTASNTLGTDSPLERKLVELRLLLRRVQEEQGMDRGGEGLVPPSARPSSRCMRTEKQPGPDCVSTPSRRRENRSLSKHIGGFGQTVQRVRLQMDTRRIVRRAPDVRTSSRLIPMTASVCSRRSRSEISREQSDLPENLVTSTRSYYPTAFRSTFPSAAGFMTHPQTC